MYCRGAKSYEKNSPIKIKVKTEKELTSVRFEKRFDSMLIIQENQKSSQEQNESVLIIYIELQSQLAIFIDSHNGNIDTKNTPRILTSGKYPLQEMILIIASQKVVTGF